MFISHSAGYPERIFPGRTEYRRDPHTEKYKRKRGEFSLTWLGSSGSIAAAERMSHNDIMLKSGGSGGILLRGHYEFVGTRMVIESESRDWDWRPRSIPA